MKYLTFLNVMIVAAVGLTANSFACSPAHTRTAKEVFKDSAYIFRGTAIRTEAVFLKNVEGADESIPIVKVYWKVDRTYKGKKIGKRATLTNLVCGGVIVNVGERYVVSLQDLQGTEHNIAGLGDTMGLLDDQGTFGEFQHPEEFSSLVAEFEKLRKEK